MYIQCKTAPQQDRDLSGTLSGMALWGLWCLIYSYCGGALHKAGWRDSPRLSGSQPLVCLPTLVTSVSHSYLRWRGVTQGGVACSPNCANARTIVPPLQRRPTVGPGSQWPPFGNSSPGQFPNWVRVRHCKGGKMGSGGVGVEGVVWWVRVVVGIVALG